MVGKSRRREREQGFTAVALLTTIVVMATLAVAVTLGIGQLASTASCATNKETVDEAQEVYKASAGVFPSNMAALTTGVHAPLSSTPTDYTVDGRGTVVAIANNRDGCR
jgi:hypothetical protein